MFCKNSLDEIHIESSCDSWESIMKKSKDDVTLNFLHVLFAVFLKQLLCFEVDHPKDG